ncbi:hypothetical protein PAXRUDRAFT_825407 [Paxillus rubicundulus Ve08.2h10]|uniref:Unplaced genomic scaffold scaffold_136, whole genome shotgun sequence n=1 Tax=Paxillus rubicundulus Ve08.2h10 TaxID=930991 RepID=A0A0D0DGE8_9AGAM|nr:hypothetical protein PAXRUDRAFT_825407 [Paxillus rubicundulus Ve08.2h10]
MPVNQSVTPFSFHGTSDIRYNIKPLFRNKQKYKQVTRSQITQGFLRMRCGKSHLAAAGRIGQVIFRIFQRAFLPTVQA